MRPAYGQARSALEHCQLPSRSTIQQYCSQNDSLIAVGRVQQAWVANSTSRTTSAPLPREPDNKELRGAAPPGQGHAAGTRLQAPRRHRPGRTRELGVARQGRRPAARSPRRPGPWSTRGIPQVHRRSVATRITDPLTRWRTQSSPAGFAPAGRRSAPVAPAPRPFVVHWTPAGRGLSRFPARREYGPGNRSLSAICPWTSRSQPDLAGLSRTWRDIGRRPARRENSQLTGRLRRWWQVLGSNQRRLSRRFYRPLPLATRATCRASFRRTGTVKDSGRAQLGQHRPPTPVGAAGPHRQQRDGGGDSLGLWQLNRRLTSFPRSIARKSTTL